jgi:catecholate siderophore receptor
LNHVNRVVAVALFSFLTPHLAAASQITFAGRVVDQAGGAIAGAAITAAPAAPAAPVTTISDSRGEFRLVLEPREYRLTIVSSGFAGLSEPLVATTTANQLRVFTLRVAGVTEVVQVGAPVLERVAAINSATKTATPLRDIPQSISVVPAALIADQRMQSMADVVRYMPGVGMAQGEGNRDTPILRGNSSTGDFYVDGVRDDAQYFRDTYNVDRIEALKGPNAMIFGRGGAGGVINRVTRQANWASTRQIEAQIGSHDNRRFSGDIGMAFHPAVAARVTGVYENSDSYRSGVGLEREGINPTVAVSLGANTTLRASYEFFRDRRTADRGVPSFNGRPVDTDPSTFFGDPALSRSRADVNIASATLEHNPGHGISVRSRTNFGVYDKHYQNVFPGNVSGNNVSVSGYDNSTDRQNLFNQTDVVVARRTGRIGHVVAAGVEVGRQVTDNFRRTAFFTTLGANVTTTLVPLSNPTSSLPVEFRQTATDADNSGTATIAAVYAQDQIALSDHVQAVVGLRFDSFNVDFRNNRSGAAFASHDDLLSPRAGLIYKPIEPVSVYASYSLAYMPRAGDQLSSLSLSNQALDPEEFHNYEIGTKWDAGALALTLATYRLDRGNVAVADPVDPTRSILVDAQRTTGVEAGVDGRLAKRWTIAGGYAFQRGEITRSISATVQAGAILAQVPRHSLSLWNKYDLSQKVAAGVGVIYRGNIFAAADNLVTLPAYTRVDSALFWNATTNLRAQFNVENMFDTKYFASAHNNSNILPGSPRAIKIALTTRF